VLTLTGPAEVNQGQTITLVATLRRGDTMGGIPGATVDFYWSVQKLGSAVTDAGGVASFTTTLQAGTYLYQARFEGAEVAGLILLPSVGAYAAGIESVVPLLILAGAAWLLMRR